MAGVGHLQVKCDDRVGTGLFLLVASQLLIWRRSSFEWPSLSTLYIELNFHIFRFETEMLQLMITGL